MNRPLRELCAERNHGKFRHEKYHKRLENIADNAGGQGRLTWVAPPAGLAEIQQKRTSLQILAQSPKWNPSCSLSASLIMHHSCDAIAAGNPSEGGLGERRAEKNSNPNRAKKVDFPSCRGTCIHFLLQFHVLAHALPRRASSALGTPDRTNP
jgi:hypothetical protein